MLTLNQDDQSSDLSRAWHDTPRALERLASDYEYLGTIGLILFMVVAAIIIIGTL